MKKNDDKSSRYKSLNIEYFKYRTTLTNKFENRKAYEKLNPKLVLAFIPGTIRKVHVSPGDEVKKGDLMLILEAMKMKNRILSPLDGKVKQVNVQPGVVVPKNHILIELE